MKLAFLHAILRSICIIFLITPCLLSAATLTQEQATKIEQCLGGNISVSTIEGELGWGPDPYQWYSSSRGWIAYHSGNYLFYTTPEAAMDAGSANTIGHTWHTTDYITRIGLAAITKNCSPNPCGSIGVHGGGSGVYDMVATAPAFNHKYNVQTSMTAWGIRITPETPTNGPIPGDTHPSDNTCTLAMLNSVLKPNPLDPDCTIEQKSGYSLNQLSNTCDINFSSSIPSKQDGKPFCSVGNPIDITSGNKFQTETIFNSVIPFQLNYNSSTSTWRHSHDYRFEVTHNAALLIRPDGKGLAFNKVNSLWVSDADVFYQITDLGTTSTERWQVITPSGNTELYDNQDRLVSKTTLAGNTTTLSYSGLTTTVTNHLGDTLQLTFNDQQQIVSASLNNTVNHNFNYDLSAENLISRTDNVGNTTQYHYEDTRFPNHLTGISGSDGKRFASWAYDDQSRGIMSEHAGQEHVELVFNTDGTTTVSNALGKQTTYHFTEIEGLKRPTLIEGHATDNCVGSNKAYTYYPSGLLETKTDWDGNITRYKYNDRGLTTLIAEAQGTLQERITTQVWDSTKPLLLERVQNNQRTRFSYSSTNQLIDTTQDSLQ